LSESNRHRVRFVSLLARYRLVGKRFLLFGRLLRPPQLFVDGRPPPTLQVSSHPATYASGAQTEDGGATTGS
jgi:hypothetical protein